MAATEQSVTGNPLIDALPPATDYITYLTLLEYQLTAQNLPTLNKLLSEDDGTLAAEIGWDLLRLVLPMLQVVPEEAGKCLEIIAQRGNPREVIVRVSEELERLRQENYGSLSNSDDEGEDEEDQDELPTFAGEATRVHLGTITLDGAPPSTVTNDKANESALKEVHNDDVRHGSDNAILFQALLSMLSILHPRIKTQYPSRFLATSLPAALSVYRHLDISHDTTTAFITTLSKLSGKQRPTLPPRTSTAGSLSRTQTDQIAQTAPLPDPERTKGVTEVSHPDSSTTMVQEKNIMERLLQAVMLEVLDDYTQSFSTSKTSNLSWTTRIRERIQPQRLIPGRLTETQKWQQEPDLQTRDTVIQNFVRLSTDLGIDCTQVIDGILALSANEVPDMEEKQEAEPAVEYPTSPADIPFPLSGLIVLHAAQTFYRTGTIPSNQEPSLRRNLQFFQRSSTEISSQGFVEVDAILSLLYGDVTAEQTDEDSEAIHSDEIVVSLRELTEIFTTNPDPFNRDNAHLVATKIIHKYADQSAKLTHIMSMLSIDREPASPIHSIQAGNLKAVAIDWLKDEIRIGGLDVDIMSTNSDLTAKVLPSIPAVPGPFISSHPPASGATDTALSSEDELEEFLLLIPAYISALNLLSILAHLLNQQPENSATMRPQHDSGSSSRSALSGPLLSRAENFVGGLEAWTETLLTLFTGMKNSGGDGPISLADVYALEDACKRARAGILHVEE